MPINNPFSQLGSTPYAQRVSMGYGADGGFGGAGGGQGGGGGYTNNPYTNAQEAESGVGGGTSTPSRGVPLYTGGPAPASSTAGGGLTSSVDSGGGEGNTYVGEGSSYNDNPTQFGDTYMNENLGLNLGLLSPFLGLLVDPYVRANNQLFDEQSASEQEELQQMQASGIDTTAPDQNIDSDFGFPDYDPYGELSEFGGTGDDRDGGGSNVGSTDRTDNAASGV